MSPASVPAHARALADWERDASRHFLEGYLKAAHGLASVPADDRTLRALLTLFLIEKAAYELGFEHVAAGPLVRSSYHADEHVKQDRPGIGPLAISA